VAVAPYNAVGPRATVHDVIAGAAKHGVTAVLAIHVISGNVRDMPRESIEPRGVFTADHIVIPGATFHDLAPCVAKHGSIAITCLIGVLTNDPIVPVAAAQIVVTIIANDAIIAGIAVH